MTRATILKSPKKPVSSITTAPIEPLLKRLSFLDRAEAKDCPQQVTMFKEREAITQILLTNQAATPSHARAQLVFALDTINSISEWLCSHDNRCQPEQKVIHITREDLGAKLDSYRSALIGLWSLYQYIDRSELFGPATIDEAEHLNSMIPPALSPH
ncbi:MAG: hypothetical protein K0R10_140 [Alphaproteobacteria bacterium]|jgi:hypothetical protein|nr:hypothetical protein [Alphaproteobacteria bacterium]